MDDLWSVWRNEKYASICTYYAALRLNHDGDFWTSIFAPYKRLKQAVASQDWSTAGTQLNQIRMMIGINLSLGLITTVIGAAGKYWI